MYNDTFFIYFSIPAFSAMDFRRIFLSIIEVVPSKNTVPWLLYANIFFIEIYIIFLKIITKPATSIFLSLANCIIKL